MGINIMKSMGYDECYFTPNPNPNRFKIKQLISLDGIYTAALIHYYGCTTYNGDKLCVYKIHPDELKKMLKLDPHFIENELSPIARFPASHEGEIYAAKLLEALK